MAQPDERDRPARPSGGGRRWQRVGATVVVAAVVALADEPGVHVIDDVVADVLARDEPRSDRIHPNREGYARMARAAFDALQRCR